jgi:GNAT superfamily N-acetyltransferase
MILDELKSKLGGEYSIISVTENIINDVFELMKQNTYFYSKTQAHDITIEECREDIYALPPGTEISQKFYVALFKGNECAAVLDYIEGYPNKSVTFIGLFMLHPKFHRTGIGSRIIRNFIDCAQSSGFAEIKLGCFEANEIGLSFWRRMGFIEEKTSVRETDGMLLNLIHMHMVLNPAMGRDVTDDN